MSAQIRFACPTCKAMMTAPVDDAGNKINCLACGQRLQIPPAGRAKTILAAGLGVEDDGVSVPPVTTPNPANAGIAAAPSPPLPPPAKLAPPLPSDMQPTEANITTPRGWLLPAKTWLLIAICASCFNFGADLISIVSSIGTTAVAHQRQAPVDFFGRRQERQESALVAGFLRVAASVVVMIIWLGVHWLLIWRRFIDLGLPIYRVWTGLHIAWTAIALIGLLVSLYWLSLLFTVEGEIGGAGYLKLFLCAGVLAVGLNLLADVGWGAVVIATPARQSKASGDAQSGNNDMTLRTSQIVAEIKPSVPSLGKNARLGGCVALAFLLLLLCIGITVAVVSGWSLVGGEGGKALRPPLNVADQLIPNDNRDTKLINSPRKVYRIALTAGAGYQIDLKSRDFDAFLRLEDSTGREVAFDDDSGGFLDARIIYNAPKSGEYKIIATSLDGRTGRFTLDVVEIAGKAPWPQPAQKKW